VGPPDSNRFRSGFLGLRDGESGAGVDAGVDAGALAEPGGVGEPDCADALHSSTVTVHVAFADPMLR
jgi:hypothetical protein